MTELQYAIFDFLSKEKRPIYQSEIETERLENQILGIDKFLLLWIHIPSSEDQILIKKQKNSWFSFTSSFGWLSGLNNA